MVARRNMFVSRLHDFQAVNLQVNSDVVFSTGGNDIRLALFARPTFATLRACQDERDKLRANGIKYGAAAMHVG